MTRTLIAGAWYGDHLPSGAFCATIPHVSFVTSLGTLPWPSGETFGIGYPRATDVGGVRFAGQAHDTLNPACWEWDGRWVPYAPPCVGVSPIIYDRDGVLHRSDGSVGSQGYRYVTPGNVIVSGDATYGPFHGLFEYTQLAPDLWIGQAAYDGGGVQVWDGTTLRQLELGDCRFVRANPDREAVALAFTRPEGVALISTTMAELRALPPVVTPEPPHPIPAPPQPPPVPVPPKPVPKPPKGDAMPFAVLDSSKVVLYKALKPSSQAGCVNVILPDGRVLSAHGDDRDPGTDGPWEQGQVAGQAVSFRADDKFWSYLILPVDKLP